MKILMRELSASTSYEQFSSLVLASPALTPRSSVRQMDCI
jgi:hypothetical protein